MRDIVAIFIVLILLIIAAVFMERAMGQRADRSSSEDRVAVVRMPISNDVAFVYVMGRSFTIIRDKSISSVTFVDEQRIEDGLARNSVTFTGGRLEHNISLETWAEAMTKIQDAKPEDIESLADALKRWQPVKNN